MEKAIFLDRDGVINKIIIKNGLPFSPPSFDQLKILPGVKESILRLKKLNFIYSYSFYFAISQII